MGQSKLKRIIGLFSTLYYTLYYNLCTLYFHREKEIDERLARMNIDLTAWKTRIESRKRLAQKEIDKRTKILAEVRHFYIWNRVFV